MTFVATAAYPYLDRERASTALRVLIVTAASARVLDWSTLFIDGSIKVPGDHGRTSFGWMASVDA